MDSPDDWIEELSLWVVPFDSLPWESLSYTEITNELSNLRFHSGRFTKKILIQGLIREYTTRYVNRRNVVITTIPVKRMFDNAIIDRQILSNNGVLPNEYIQALQNENFIQNLNLQKSKLASINAEIRSLGGKNQKLKTAGITDLLDRIRYQIHNMGILYIPTNLEIRGFFLKNLREFWRSQNNVSIGGPDVFVTPRWKLQDPSYFLDRTIGRFNPYLLLTDRILTLIAEERDVDIGTGSFIERATRLDELDQILFDYRETIISCPRNQLIDLSLSQLYVYASISGLDVRALVQENLERMDLFETIFGLLVFSSIPPNTQPIKLKIEKTCIVVTSLNDFLGAISKGIYPLIQLSPTDSDMISPSICEELVQYPIAISKEDYCIIRRFRGSNLKMAVSLKFQNMILFYTKEDAIFVLSRGYEPHFNEDRKKVIQRYAYLRGLPRKIRPLLIQLYHVEDEENPLVKIAFLPPKPLELVLAGINHYSLEMLASSVGMVIPPSLSEGVTPERYFFDNILEYEEILTRNSDLPSFNYKQITEESPTMLRILFRRYKDSEIFSFSGIYINYTSRRDLIEQIIQLRITSSFFVPLERRCQNSKTMLFNSTADPDLFIISYGTLSHYIGYELEELQHSFQNKEPHHGSDEMEEFVDDFVFLRPDDIRSKFSIDKIEHLQILLSCFLSNPSPPQSLHSGGPSISELINHISNGLDIIRQKSDYDRGIVRIFRRFDSEIQGQIREYLYNLFFAGMYMRRWKGPGYPYPHKKTETEDSSGKFLPDYNTSVALLRITKHLEQIPLEYQNFCLDIRIVEFYKKDPDQTVIKIRGYLNDVMNEKECIRMASSKFGGTGFYYLRLFFRETIPNFDPTTLDRVM